MFALEERPPHTWTSPRAAAEAPMPPRRDKFSRCFIVYQRSKLSHENQGVNREYLSSAGLYLHGLVDNSTFLKQSSRPRGVEIKVCFPDKFPKSARLNELDNHHIQNKGLDQFVITWSIYKEVKGPSTISIPDHAPAEGGIPVFPRVTSARHVNETRGSAERRNRPKEKKRRLRD